jgi:phospholipid/cholesterol/gamma-HCH transport system substrate-binding protein
MSRNALETLIGALVLIIALAFLIFSYKTADMLPNGDGYNLSAKFEQADGISLGSEIRIAGVKIGKVIGQSLDKSSYNALITMNINNDVQIPADSSAKIVSDGLLGNKYIAIAVGGDDDMLKNNGVITITQSSVNLETLIGKVIFDTDKNKKQDEIEQK